MAVVCLPPLLVAGSIQGRAIRHDDVVAAVSRRIPYGLVLAHQYHGDAARQPTQRRRCYGRGWRFDSAEGRMRRAGGDVVPYS